MTDLRKVRRYSLGGLMAVLVVAAVVVIAHAAGTPSQSAGEGGIVIEERNLIQLPGARLKQVVAGAEVADLQQLQRFYFTDGAPHIRVGNREYPLAPVPTQEYAPPAEEAATAQSLAAALRMYGQYIMGGPTVVGRAGVAAAVTSPPPAVNHRRMQTPVKDQGNRWTHISFASIAALEAAYGSRSLDLSEQYAHYLHMQALGKGCRYPPFGYPFVAPYWTNVAADALSEHGVCRETTCPYYSDGYDPPAYCNNSGAPAPAQRADAAAHSPYQIESHWKLWRHSDIETDTEFCINNPRCLEALLASGKDIVLEMYIAGWTPPMGGVIGVKLSGNPITGYYPMSPQGIHTVLIVGYEQAAPGYPPGNPYGGGYFIAKNSWGTDVGHAGYLYLSYNYLRAYALCGYVIGEVVRPHVQPTTAPVTSRPGRSITPRRSR